MFFTTFGTLSQLYIDYTKSRVFQVVIFREKETKRYDFEAQNAIDATDIVEEVKRGMQPYQNQDRELV